ncbi:hypothetical protein ACFQ67_12515 [Streptomyces sp. NPDC056488]|uniref:hypothetical protein n=1 Tax=Streptomyces sp. NPDC056488 TaxID=3345836 RepID=UPI0036C9C4BF
MGTPQAADTSGGDFVPLIRTVAGSGTAGFKGEEEPAVSAQLNRPYGVAVDSTGNLYLSDHLNHRIRKVTTDGGSARSRVTGPGRTGVTTVLPSRPG